MKKGMIYSPAHGSMAFTVPLFDELAKKSAISRKENHSVDYNGIAALFV